MATMLDISAARRQFTKLDEQLRSDRLIWITRHNKKAFAVVDTDLMQAILETLEILQDPGELRMFQESLADIRAGRLHDHEDVKKELLDEEEARLDLLDEHRPRTVKKAAGQGKARPAGKGR